MMTKEQAREFAARWLPAWTGNNPERLAAFYSDDALYLDPQIPEGIRGKDALLTYFSVLLARYPDWTWIQIEAFPMEDGFLNKWRAEIPMAERTVVCIGVCFVQLDDDGLIMRNEVDFDRSELLAEIKRAQS